MSGGSTHISPVSGAIDDVIVDAIRMARDEGRSDRDALQDVARDLAGILGKLVAHIAPDYGSLQRALHLHNGIAEEKALRTHSDLGRSRGRPR